MTFPVEEDKAFWTVALSSSVAFEVLTSTILSSLPDDAAVFDERIAWLRSRLRVWWYARHLKEIKRCLAAMSRLTR